MIGPKSKERLATVHEVLSEIVYNAAPRTEFCVICGHRGEKEQNDAVARGMSKLKYPLSKHNRTPSLAVDLLPLPSQWSDRNAFTRLAVVIDDEAKRLGARVRWGGDWNSNGRSDDEKFYDGAHFELVKYRDSSGKVVEV